MIFKIPFINLYEGEGSSEGNTNEGGAPKDFTPEQQAIFNNAMAAERRKYLDKVKTLEDNLKKAGLSAEQVKNLETELENLRASSRTAEEQAAHERVQLTNKHKQEVEVITQQSQAWQTRYTNMAIGNSLLTAATENNAFNPTQLVQILRPNTRLVEVVDGEGKKTGDFVPKVKISLPNDKGEMVELDLSPSDAVKRMAGAKELFGNLFKSSVTGGVGGNPNNTSGDGSDQSLDKIAKSGNVEGYLAQRKKQRGL